MAETLFIDGPQGALAGELISVSGARHVVVIIPGSGPVNRDGNVPQSGVRSNSYKMFAEGLASIGVASIRIDKRGMFGSRLAISDPNKVTIADYAGDVADWVSTASGHAACVWLAGHSEGGLVALVTAVVNRPEALCGLILMATPGRKVGSLLRAQLAANPSNQTLLPEIDRTIATLEQGIQVEPAQLAAPLRGLFNKQVQPFLIDLFSHDPAEIARHWNGPVLVLQGDADIQVGKQDAELLTQAFPQVEQVILKDATHMLKTDVPGKPLATYTDPSIPLHADLLRSVGHFLSGSPD